MSENTKQIPLTRGKFATVDAADYEFLAQWKWYCTPMGYAARSVRFGADGVRKKDTIYMHRVLLPESSEVDHKDRDKLNNTRSNIRAADRSKNNANRGKKEGCTSQYIGVAWNDRKNKWQASIKLNKKHYYLGRYPTEELAADAYNKKAVELYGEFANLNLISNG